ncbi:MAG: heavy metal translocating P-type ATPase metal-binding domain-containing protein [Planctomycetota bacterium]
MTGLLSSSSPPPPSAATPADRSDAATFDADTPCRHCGLPLGRFWKPEYGPFCCNGCKAVCELIHSEGLDTFYKLRQGPLTPPPRLRPDTFAWLDRLLAEMAPADPLQPAHITLDVQGVHCAACIWLLEELLRRRAGGLDIRINPALGKAEITWIPARLDLREYLRDAERFGYRFGPSIKDDHRHSSGILVRLGICAAAAMNTMIFSFCFYFGMDAQDGKLYELFGRVSLGLALLAVLTGGSVFVKSAWLGLRHGLVHLDLPIALGILLGFGGSALAYHRGGPAAAYFDTVTIFITLMLVGRWLQERVLEKNRHALLASDRVENLSVRRFRAGRLEVASASAVEAGDELLLLPGDLVPVEGVLQLKPASLALDWITGESEVRVVEPGEKVPAGAFNADRSSLQMVASEPFTVSRLLTLLCPAHSEEGAAIAGGKSRGREAPRRDTSRRNTTRHDNWWRRIATLYVVAVLGLAATGFVAWLGQSLDRAIEVAVAVLVVTCPCALGLATPLAHELVHVALRRFGIFLRDGAFLHKALRVRKILFDKTGTLTQGTLRLTARGRAALKALDEIEKTVLFNMTARSHHPASRCVLSALGGEPSGWRLHRDMDVVETPGIGLESRWQGKCYRLGRSSFVMVQETPREERRGATPAVHFGVDGQLRARLALEEELEADAVDEVARLHAQGYEVHQLSGDDAGRVGEAARRLGIPAQRSAGGLTPEEKAARVRTLDRHDTLMVGDGLNDGPAFEAATCCATPAVDRTTLPGKADFYFLGEGIAAVRRSLAAARRLRAVVRDNLVLAIAYNVLAVSLALAGLVSPVVAAVAMPLSSVTLVTLTASRLSGTHLTWMS